MLVVKLANQGKSLKMHQNEVSSCANGVRKRALMHVETLCLNSSAEVDEAVFKENIGQKLYRVSCCTASKIEEN